MNSKWANTATASLAALMLLLGILIPGLGLMLGWQPAASDPASFTLQRDAIEDQFNQAYYASLKPTVREAMRIKDFDARVAALRALAQSGEVIDADLMVYWLQPYPMMKLRMGMGLTWVPSLLQPWVPFMPGLVWPGLPTYDPTNPPAGSVKVINPDDRSQWPAPWPVEVAPKAEGSLVGRHLGGAVYGCGNQECLGLKAGTERRVEGQTFVKQVIRQAIGESHFWLRKD